MQLRAADLELGRQIRNENCGPELSPVPFLGLGVLIYHPDKRLDCINLLQFLSASVMEELDLRRIHWPMN